MKRNSKLFLALHALGHMALEPSKRVKSDDIAKMHQTNPVVVRRVLGRLREVGLMSSEKGHAGGWCLTRPPAKIAVAEIYIALGEAQYQVVRDTPPNCAIERHLFDTFEEATSEAERLLIDRLREVTLADLAEAMRQSPPPRPA